MMVNTFLGMEIARRDASVFGAAHAERPQSYAEKTDCALQRRGNHCFRAGKPGKLTEKVSGKVSRKVSGWKRPSFTRLAPNCMLRAAARQWEEGLWRSPCTELHITGGGSAIGARLVAYLRRLGNRSKPCCARLAHKLRSPCTLIPTSRREKVHKSAQVDLT